MVAGWLVWRGHPLADALAAVRAARPVAEPNPGFLSQLRRWEAATGPGRAGAAGAAGRLAGAAAAVAMAASASAGEGATAEAAAADEEGEGGEGREEDSAAAP